MREETPRKLSRLDAWAMAFGCMVGWGAFVMPGTTFLPVAGPAGTIIAMAIGAAVMLVIGRNFAWLMGRSPRAGGVYAYTKEAFGRDHAFRCSWFLCLSYLTIVFLNGTAIFVVIKTLFGDTAQQGYHYAIAGNDVYLTEIAVTVAALAGVGLLFVLARPFLQRIHTALSLALMAGVMIVGAACLPRVDMAAALRSFGTHGVGGAYGTFSIVILAPWAFVGFEMIAFDTPNFGFPVGRSGGVIATAILLAAAVYMCMTLVSIASAPAGYGSWMAYIEDLDTLGGTASVPAFNAARAVMGTAGLWLMAITACAAILTGIIGAYRAAMRVLTAMAEDRILSDRFSRAAYSILFVMVLSILISLLGRNTLSWFVDLTAFGAIVSFGYTSAAAYKLARAEGNRGVMATGMAGAAISAAFAVVQLVPRLTAMEAMGGEAFLLLSPWCLMGFVFYWRTVKHSTLSEYSGISASGVVLFALLLYAALMWLAKTLMAQDSLEAVRMTIGWGASILILITFLGLAVMLYIQDLVRGKHEAAEREKIRAVEGSLAKSQFLFNMSHDIRTPMNAIIGYTALAQKEDAPEVLHDYLNKIETSSQHLLTLINDILEMSRIESGKMDLEFAPTALCEAFEGVRDLFAEQMRQKNIDFSVHAAQVRNPYVWCDRRNLERVLINVIGNAYKFTPAGGSIVATLCELGQPENGYGAYEMRIQDSGIGMSKAFVEKMFNAFERERTSTDSGVEGTGLGLAITRRIVDLMGGDIDVHTAPGCGTTMVIRLKLRLAEPETVAQEIEDHAPAAVDFSGKRLLLVEDNAVNLEIAVMILEDAGFTVETAENGQIAVDMVAASQPGHYDAILMDIQMPVMDGYTATRRIRQLENPALADIPILAMTANAFKEDERAAAEAGMQAHIAKPIDVDVMLSKIAEALRGRAYGNLQK